MKCNHCVHSHEWKRCPKCGKIVRINRKREIIRAILIVLSILLIIPSIADWGIEFFHLAEHNPHNVTHALIGCIPLIVICILLQRIFPIHDEKEQDQ